MSRKAIAIKENSRKPFIEEKLAINPENFSIEFLNGNQYDFRKCNMVFYLKKHRQEKKKKEPKVVFGQLRIIDDKGFNEKDDFNVDEEV